VDVVESRLYEGVHHEASGPYTHSYTNLTVFFGLESEASAVVVGVNGSGKAGLEGLDVVFCFDFDAVAFEEVDGAGSELALLFHSRLRASGLGWNILRKVKVSRWQQFLRVTY